MRTRQQFLFFCLLALRLSFEVEAAKDLHGSFSPLYEALFSNKADRDPKASPFIILGGISIAPPCCTSLGKGRMDCFIIDQDAKIQHITKENGDYGSWKEVASVFSKELECFSRKEGTIELISLDQNFRIVSMSYAEGKWTSNWEILIDNPVMDVPSCSVRHENLVDCVTRSLNHRGLYFAQTKGKWASLFNPLRLKQAMSPIRCKSTTDLDLDCFALGVQSQMMWRTFRKVKGRRLISDIEGTVSSKAEIITWKGYKDIGLFVLGQDNGLLYNQLSGGVLVEWLNLGGKFTTVPRCFGLGQSTIYCIGIGEKSRLYRRSNKEDEDHWIPSYGTFLDGLACVITDEDKWELTCLVRGFDRTIVEVVYRLK